MGKCVSTMGQLSPCTLPDVDLGPPEASELQTVVETSFSNLVPLVNSSCSDDFSSSRGSNLCSD